MNVFDLPGPEFIVGYVVVGAFVALAVYIILSLPVGDEPALPFLADPYQIAYLRSGRLAAAQVAAISLLDRGLLRIEKTRLIPEDARAPRSLHPIEQSILTVCPRPIGNARRVLNSGPVKEACNVVVDLLVDAGLAPNGREKLTRALISLGAGIVVVGAGVAKLVIAQQRGHPNVGFLVVAVVVASVFFLVMALPPYRTPRGARMLRDLRRLLDQRRTRTSENPPANEALLLAGVFGAAGLVGYGDLRTAYAGMMGNTGGSSGNGCGSSGCGGSGCGGGGGCGGCGSG
jgi:uncharacterized protein (TIGR04222 family)